MQLEFKKPVDILFSISWSAILLLLIIFNIKGAIRVIFGLPFVIFIPGYLFILILFPTHDEIDIIERIALSFGLSIAIVPLVGLALNYTPWGIRLASVAASLGMLVFLFAGVAAWRWYSIPPDKRFRIRFSIELPENRVDKILSVALVISIVLSLALLVYLIITPHQGEKFTEFYILGPNGKAEGYPTNLSINETAKVIIGVANHEGRTLNYTIETWLVKYNSYLSFNGKSYAISNISKPFKAATIEAWIMCSKKDTVYSKTYEAENYTKEGRIYKNGSIRSIKLTPGIDEPGYVCSINLPKLNGPFSISILSKISGNRSNTAWRAEIYEGKRLKWKYEMDAGEYKKIGLYQWKESPVWFMDGSKSYKMKLYWYGTTDLYIDKISIIARRGAIGKNGACMQAMVFDSISKDKLRIGYFTKMVDNSVHHTWFNASINRDGKFHLVSVVFENGTKKCYIDGKLMDSVITGGELSDDESNIIIGGGYGYFFGSIDDVRIYNRALTSVEIQQNYHGNITMNGLIAWWKFNEGYGNITHDAICGYEAEIHGCTWEYGNITHMWFMDKIEVRLNSTRVNIEKEWQPQWEYNYTFSINKKGLFKLAFLLFKEEQKNFTKLQDYPEEAKRIDNAYRECHLWIKVHS